MSGRVQLKICGITSIEDGLAAAGIGADYLGFILYPKSPRFLPVEKYPALSSRLPAVTKVAVMIEPSADELARIRDLGFDRFQIHFSDGAKDPGSAPPATVETWSETVGADRLWLAPRLAPGSALSSRLLTLSSTFLIDTFHRDKFGGTGETGDWPRFAELRRLHPAKTWILSGGLTPQNIPAALAVTGATFIDVNSGVEAKPGVKDPAKLQALAAALGGSYR